MDVEFDLVPEEEFDALCVEVKQPKDDASQDLVKYPAKTHARKVAAELGVDKGLIYLPGEPNRIYDDSDIGPVLRQRRYFYYVTGVEISDCYVTYDIEPDLLMLWIPYSDPREILWFGHTPTSGEAMQMYDVDYVRYTNLLPKYLRSKPQRSKTLYVLSKDQTPSFDSGDGSSQVWTGSIDHASLRPAMDEARVIKTDAEVALLRRATAVTSAAHRRVAQNLLRLRNEREIQAIHIAVCTALGAPAQAYPVIAGAGSNAASLHYEDNNQPLKGKQLVIIDAGCEWNCYASDVTRTLPISGFFTPEAKAIHNVVQRMQDECIASLAPSVFFVGLHLHANRVAIEGLLNLGILKGDAREIEQAGTVTAFFPHGLGHHVGLIVHDVSGRERIMVKETLGSLGGKRETISPGDLAALRAENMSARYRPLEPNMVVTVEPGIYFCREYIEGYFLNNPRHSKFIDTDLLERYYDVGGVRIEDTILITEDGYDNLTTAPKGQELLDVINGGSSAVEELIF